MAVTQLDVNHDEMHIHTEMESWVNDGAKVTMETDES